MPVVMLVLEGGVNTLLTVAEATEKHTPVVVISGSGRAADLIAWCYNHTKYLAELDASVPGSRVTRDLPRYGVGIIFFCQICIKSCLMFLK